MLAVGTLALVVSAMLLPECRHLWDGVEAADSVAWNPHKWMGTILDCSLFYVRDPQHLVRVMSTNPSYLQTAADGQWLRAQLARLSGFRSMHDSDFTK